MCVLTVAGAVRNCVIDDDGQVFLNPASGTASLDEVAEATARWWHEAAGLKPTKHMIFRRIVPEETPGTEATWAEMGESGLKVDPCLVYHGTLVGQGMTVREIGAAYRAYCRADDEMPDGAEHARDVKPWDIYMALCLLVGAGFGVWSLGDEEE